MDKEESKNLLRASIDHLYSVLPSDCDRDWIEEVARIYSDNTDGGMPLPSFFYNEGGRVTLDWKNDGIHITQDIIKDDNFCYTHIADLGKGTFEEWEFEINVDVNLVDNFIKIKNYLKR